MTPDQIKIIQNHLESSDEPVIQLIVALEEMSELQKEVCKTLRGKGNLDNFIEELGDVMIMLENLKLYFHISDDELNETIHFKLNRLVNDSQQKQGL